MLAVFRRFSPSSWQVVFALSIVLLSLFALPNGAYAQNPGQLGCPDGYEVIGYDSPRDGGAPQCRSTDDSSFLGRSSMAMIDYSLGINNQNNCFSCTFTQQFLLALSSFSAAVFMYFRAFFVTLMPLLMAIWIAWSVGRVMIAGGDGGGQFFGAMVRKMALFFMLWGLLMFQNPTGNPRNPSQQMTVANADAPWTWFGPRALEYGLTLSNEVRTTASRNLSIGNTQGNITGQLNMGCTDVGTLNSTLASNRTAYEFALQASEMTCAIERIHIVGLASGVAMIEGAWLSLQLSAWTPIESVRNMLGAMVITGFGLFILVTFAFSMIWFIFLIMDVVVKVLIIAGIAPILMLFALFIPTRSYATKAITGTVGALSTLVGLAFIGALAFYLIGNTPNVYETAKALYDPTLPDIEGGNTIARLRSFLMGVQTDEGQPGHIPMSIATPWFHYMLLTSLSISALGKKIIAIIESLTGASALSQMADNARQVAVMGSALGVASTFFLGKGAMWATGKGARGVTMTAGGLRTAGSFIATKRAEGLSAAVGSINPFGNAASTAESSVASTLSTTRSGQNSLLRQTMDIQREASQRLDEADGGGAAGRG